MITLEEGEKIITEIRKHWWRLFTWGFGLLVLSILPILVGIVILVFTGVEFTDSQIYTAGLFYTMWITVLWILFFIEWTDYYLDVWIVTNHRIIDIEQKGLFSRDIATVRLEDIHDIKVEFSGVIPTLFKFGSISVQSSGAHTEFLLRNANNPERAKEMIYDFIDRAKKAKYD